MSIINWLYEKLTGRLAPTDLPEEWKRPSRFRKASIIIVAVSLVLSAVAAEHFPDVPAPPSDVPNVEPWPLHKYLFWGAVSWASLSLIVFALNRKWGDALLCLAWYAAFAVLTFGYLLIANRCIKSARPTPAAHDAAYLFPRFIQLMESNPARSR